MYVCHCRAITDTAIWDELARGVRDEASLAATCGVGARCGGCLTLVRQLLMEFDGAVPSGAPG